MKNVVICGGGINGASLAYYLAKKGQKCTIVEKNGIACAASGKSGGFLAKDWSDGTDLQQLSRTSFDLHMGLMDEFKNCDYRKLDTLSVSVREGSKRKPKMELPNWIDGKVTDCSTIGNTATTAQVHPYKLSTTFIDKAKELAGSEVLIGEVTSINTSNDKIVSVQVNHKDLIPADIVVITMGPWSGQARKWISMPVIEGHRAHSIVIKPKGSISPHALFIEHTEGTRHCSPEIYPRPDGTVYACGMSDDVSLPNDADQIVPNSNSCKTLSDICGKVSSDLQGAEVVAEQACYLPVSRYGLPMIGRLSGVSGAYMAAGHSCWGILNAPATGTALAELIVDGKSTTVDLSPFDPQRFTR